MRDRINIVGWSPYRRVGGVTGHIVAMCGIAAGYFKLKVDVRADHFGPRPLEKYFWDFRKMSLISESEDFYSGPDYPDYSKRVGQYYDNYTEVFKRRVRVHAIAENLNLLPPIVFMDESAFDGASGDVCFVDSSGMNSLYSFHVLDESDLILVFLPGNPVEVRKFFYQYSYLIQKCFFIINRLSPKELFIIDIVKEYGVPDERVAGIPYCDDYARACRERTVDSFIFGQLGKNTVTEYFLRIKNLTKRVLIEGRTAASGEMILHL